MNKNTEAWTQIQEIWQQPQSSFNSSATASHISKIFVYKWCSSRLWFMISKDMILNWILSGEIIVALAPPPNS